MRIAVIGAGKMGMAFSSSFVRKGLVAVKEVLLVEPRVEAHAELKSQGFSWIVSTVSEDVKECDLVILAVKPQDFPALAMELKLHIRPEQIVLSIMAGIGTVKIANMLNSKKIVRCMPNTPAQLGVGITGYFSQGLDAEEVSTVKSFLESTGKALELKEEGLLNAVTAISGSGPAYFYYFLRAMVQAGKTLGVSEDLAKELACETMLGAYHLAKNSDTSFDDLIKAVASKGGTTEAALNTFDLHDVSESIKKGIINAESRAWELSQVSGDSSSK